MSAFSFSAFVALVDQFLARRSEVVDGIESRLLNVQGKDTSQRRDRRDLEQVLDGCFFGLPRLPLDLARLKGQLAAAHLGDGFEPVPLEKFSNELDPLELIVRAYRYWDLHRWPGRSGRSAYAQCIFAVFVLRLIEALTLRLWDDGLEPAAHRLQELQRLLDALNAAAVPSPFVRDVRWLMQTAQGPLTRNLRPYFNIADRVARSLSASVRLGLHAAGAKLGGGHLRSQLRYSVWNTSRPIDDPESVAFTRNSNSMDNALLVADLVALLDAYRIARDEGDAETRLDLADAILQGLSADPELFVARLDLLAPYTMIEDIFLERDADGRPRPTPMGTAHQGVLARYGQLIGDLAASLNEDAAAFDPAHGVYSPYGIAYGFVTDVLSNMAAGALLSQPTFGLSLEDVFISRGRLEEKLARAKGWQALPRRDGEREHFDHSSEFAAEIFARLTRTLRARAERPLEPNASGVPRARVFVVPESVPVDALPDGFLPAGALDARELCFTSDVARGETGAALPYPKDQILTDRREARFLASAESDGAWFAVSKIILTLFTSLGSDAVITGVPDSVIEILRVTCPELIEIANLPIRN